MFIKHLPNTSDGRYNTDFVGGDGTSIEDEKKAQDKNSQKKISVNNKDGISK